MAKAKEFQSDLEGRSVGDLEGIWLSILVTTRCIVIVSTVNALGYNCKSRTEEGINPNQDFPYDLMDRTLCIWNISGRTINEIFRDHLFQLSFTFHGDMEAMFWVVLLFSLLNFFSGTLAMYSLIILYSNRFIMSSHTFKWTLPKLSRA